MHGFYNKILIVDLTARTSRVEALPDAVLAETLGGKGLATRLLLEHAPAGWTRSPRRTPSSSPWAR